MIWRNTEEQQQKLMVSWWIFDVSKNKAKFERIIS